MVMTNDKPRLSNFQIFCDNHPQCKGCPYNFLSKIRDCETAYYYQHPEANDRIRLYQGD